MSVGFVYAGVVRWPGGGQMTAPPDTLGGVFRLGVGGSDWEHMTQGLPEECHVPCITVDPHDGRRIYAGTQEGPYLSTDNGATWKRLNFPHRDLQVWAIAVHPQDARRIYVGTSPLGVFISEDGGGHFRRAHGADLPDVTDMRGFRNRVMRFAFNPSNPAEIYAALEVRGVIRSTDGGETWTDCSAHLIELAEQPHLKSAILTSHTAEGMLDVHALAISAAAPDVPILALRMGLFRSEDQGAHWQDLEMRKRTPIFYGRDVRVCPHDPNRLFCTMSTAASGETGTVWHSRDLGQSWERFDKPTKAQSTMMAAVPSPSRPGVVYAVARKGQVFGTTDDGAHWQEVPLPKGCNGALALGVS